MFISVGDLLTTNARNDKAAVSLCGPRLTHVMSLTVRLIALCWYLPLYSGVIREAVTLTGPSLLSVT